MGIEGHSVHLVVLPNTQLLEAELQPHPAPSLQAQGVARFVQATHFGCELHSKQVVLDPNSQVEVFPDQPQPTPELAQPHWSWMARQVEHTGIVGHSTQEVVEPNSHWEVFVLHPQLMFEAAHSHSVWMALHARHAGRVAHSRQSVVTLLAAASRHCDKVEVQPQPLIALPVHASALPPVQSTESTPVQQQATVNNRRNILK